MGSTFPLLHLCSTLWSSIVTSLNHAVLPWERCVPSVDTVCVASLGPVSRVILLSVRGTWEHLYYTSFSARFIWHGALMRASVNQPGPSSLLGVLEHPHELQLTSWVQNLDFHQRPRQTPKEIFGAFVYNANSYLTWILANSSYLSLYAVPSTYTRQFTAFLGFSCPTWQPGRTCVTQKSEE